MTKMVTKKDISTATATKMTSKQIVDKFVQGAINWPREVKMGNKLIQTHGADIFTFIVLGKKVFSLSWFLTVEGGKFIAAEKKRMEVLTFNKAKEFVADSDGYENKFKPQKTLKDLLN